MSDQNTLRDTLEAAFEEQTNQSNEVKNEPVATESSSERVRDAQGRFSSTKESAPVEASLTSPPSAPEAPPVADTLQRPTTWKKDYLSMWDKMTTGQPLSPEETNKFLAYVGNQRENEYKTGVSTYRQEAEQAKQLQEALSPIMPLLQQYNTPPARWIQDVGHVHQTLLSGTSQQKFQMLSDLARIYNIPLQAVAQGGQVDPIVTQFMEQTSSLSQELNNLKSWKEQQEQQAAQQEIAKFQDTSKYPHFEQVRETMAGLLQAGLAQDLQAAYDKAVRMNDEVWQAEQERQAQENAAKQAQEKAAATARAKSQAVSVKTATPSGTVNSMNGKGLRDQLSTAFDERLGRV